MGRAEVLQGVRQMRFEELLDRHEGGELSQEEAASMLGISDRTFRRWRDRRRDEGPAGLVDRRIGKPSSRRAAVDEILRMLGLYEERYSGFTVKHFHEQLVKRHGYKLGYTVTRLSLQGAGLVRPAPRRSAHRKKRPRRPLPGMMLHQDASRFAWLPGDGRQYDLVVTLDDATSALYSAFLVEEEGTASTFCGLLEVFVAHGLACALYTDRASHYFYTDKAGEAVDKAHLTQVGRALDRLGVEHIPAYSPEARGRSERMFGTLQDRLVKELKHAGVSDIATANQWLRTVYLPRHNARFAKPAALPEKAFVAADPALLSETLCIEEERVVGRDNTLSYRGLKLQLPESRMRAHYVKARVRVREYPDGSLAVLHGPRCVCRYDQAGCQISVPTPSSLAPCSTPSRRGLEAPASAARPPRRPALTASRHEAPASPWVGTKKRASRSNKETTLEAGSS